jgi:hypothetical protein
MNNKMLALLLILSEMSDEFDLSASASLIAPSVPTLVAAFSENQMKKQVCYSRDRVK